MIRSLRHLIVAVAVCAIASNYCQAQIINSPTPIRSFYYDYKLANPALTAVKGHHTISNAYTRDESGQFNPVEMAYASYELSLKPINGGAGLISSFDEIGAIRHAHIGLLYSQNLRIGESNGFRIGTQIAYQREKIDFSKFEFIDPTAPADPSFERMTITNSINASFGVVYYFSKTMIGGSLTNLSTRGDDGASFNLLVNNNFRLTEFIKANPSFILIRDLRETSAHLNAALEIKKWVLIGAGYRIARENRSNVDLNIGLNIKDWVQLITHVYSSDYKRFREDNQAASWIESMIRVQIPYRESNEL